MVQLVWSLFKNIKENNQKKKKKEKDFNDKFIIEW